jgi:hypothetical protein
MTDIKQNPWKKFVFKVDNEIAAIWDGSQPRGPYLHPLVFEQMLDRLWEHARRTRASKAKPLSANGPRMANPRQCALSSPRTAARSM